MKSGSREVEGERVPLSRNIFQSGALPFEWLTWLDPESLLKVRVACIRLDLSEEDRAWKNLCALELGVHSMQLDLVGPPPVEHGARCFSPWRRVFYDLDVGNVHNELRHKGEHYDFFPGRRGEPGQIPSHLHFATDHRGKTTSCTLHGVLGNDRCVVSDAPLSPLLAATALPSQSGTGTSPDEWQWRVAYRSCSYYEVAIGTESSLEMPGVTPCVSIGLCTPRRTRDSIARRQSGWDHDSWALHGDDGNYYHGSGHGKLFSPIPLHNARLGCPESQADPRVVRFGRGDIVGCGIVYLANYEPMHEDTDSGVTSDVEYFVLPEIIGGVLSSTNTLRGIFFTLNGTFLGAVRLMHEPPSAIQLWPCVGIDAPWTLSFNFGQAPFAYDLDMAFRPLEIRLESPYDTLERWSVSPSERNADSEESLTSVDEQPGWRPLSSKLRPPPALGPWVVAPAEAALRRFVAPKSSRYFFARGNAFQELLLGTGALQYQELPQN